MPKNCTAIEAKKKCYKCRSNRVGMAKKPSPRQQIKEWTRKNNPCARKRVLINDLSGIMLPQPLHKSLITNYIVD